MILRGRKTILATPRLWIGLGIACLWASTMWRVWRNEQGRVGAGLRDMGITQEMVLSTWTDYDQWMAVRQNGEWIGTTHLAIVQEHLPEPPPEKARTPQPLPDFFLDYRTRLNVSAMGLKLPVDVRAAVRMNSAFEMETMSAQGDLMGQKIDVYAFVEDRALYYRVSRKGGASAAGAQPGTDKAGVGGLGGLFAAADTVGRSPIQGPIVLSDVILPVINRVETLKEGDEWTAQVANPLKGEVGQTVTVRVEASETIEVGGQPRVAWRLTERVGGMTSTVWYDKTGKAVRRELPGGLVMEQVGREQVWAHDEKWREEPAPLEEPDRDYMRANLDPAYTDVALQQLLPTMPGM